jgi:hypothetical protein
MKWSDGVTEFWGDGMMEYWNSGVLKREIVAQISNLRYRTVSFCEVFKQSARRENSGGLPIGNRRYSRLEICATFR